MNQIIINGLKVFAYHGVHEFEKTNGQNFYVDAVCKTNKLNGYVTDNLEDTVSYHAIIKSIKSTMLEKSNNLIEYTAEKIAEKLLSDFHEINEIELTLKKPEAPIDETFNYVAVKIKRTRN